MDIKSFRCFQHVDWSPDRETLRKFAVSMAVGFAVIAGIVYLRTRAPQKAEVLLVIGIGLAALSFVPVVGRMAYLAVYLPTSVIGFVISHVVLTAIFFLVITPLAALLRMMGKDLLRLRGDGKSSLWVDHRRKMETRSYYRQF